MSHFAGSFGGPPGPTNAGDERAAFEADREARRQAEANRDADEFAAWQAEKAAARQAEQDKADARRAATEEAAALADRRAAEDAALCPRCEAPRNNPARAGHPHQEYLPHCWACGFGSLPDQTYPDVAAES